MPRPKNQRDEFAEQYLAGIFMDAGWAVYFPRKDKGFDFIISKETDAGMVVRPVQIKGKFPEKKTGVVKKYGYRGKLTAMHKEMVLAIAFFTSLSRLPHPDCVAYMPFGKITKTSKEGTFSCGPAKFQQGVISPIETYNQYFDVAGLSALEATDWA
jgi:hypothetical protein